MGWRLFSLMEVILSNRLGSCSSCSSTGSEYCCWLSFYFILFPLVINHHITGLIM
jgi:hypothetical protein